MNQQEVVTLMESSKSEAEWNTNCTQVKSACGGYPSFWHSAIIASGLANRVVKSFGSSTDIKASGLSRKPIQSLYGRPTSMPHLGKNEKVIGVYDQGLGKKYMICNSLAEMQSLYDFYAQGMALTLEWFIEDHSESTIATS